MPIARRNPQLNSIDFERVENIQRVYEAMIEAEMAGDKKRAHELKESMDHLLHWHYGMYFAIGWGSLTTPYGYI